MLKAGFFLFVLKFKIYLKFPVSLNFCILSLFLVNDPKALHINPRCLKRISEMDLSPTNKNLFTFFFLLYLENKISPTQELSL